MSTASKLLIDTDVLIDFLRGKPVARQLLESAIPTYSACVSVVTVAEIIAGMRPSEEKATEEFLQGFVVIPVSEEIARLAGSLRNRHKRVLLPDCLIAATALAGAAALLTFNRRDYPFSELQFYSGE